jgi:hypothetical protein
MKRILLVFFLFHAAGICCGQFLQDEPAKPTTHGIGIAIGVNQEKEANLLPFVHSGFVATLSYELRRQKRNFQSFRFALGFSRIGTSADAYDKGLNVPVNAAYSYNFRLLDAAGMKYFLGPLADASYSFSFYPDWDDSHAYWATNISLGVNNILIVTLPNNTRLLTSVSLPLLSFYSRPDPLRLYKSDEVSFGSLFNDMHKNMKAGFWDAAFFIHMNLEYQFPVFQTKTEAVFYTFDYSRIKKADGNPWTQLLHQFGLKVML